MYHRLVLVVGPAGSGKTTALRGLCNAEGLPYVNLNVALSQRLLEHASKGRPCSERDSRISEVQARAEHAFLGHPHAYAAIPRPRNPLRGNSSSGQIPFGP